MNEKQKSGLLGKNIVVVVMLILMLVGGTFALFIWETNNAQRTSVVFTYNDSFKCAVDGGGNITSDQIGLVPTDCLNSEHAIKREIKVMPTIVGDNIDVSMDLWLDINDIGQGLSNSFNFKYALTTNENSCTDGVIAQGNFNQKTTGGQANLLEGINYSETVTDTYYLYIWLDEAETSSSTMNQTFNLSLGGSCEATQAASKPVLDEGMIPVVISDDGTVKTISSDDSDWYNYTQQKWANIVLVSSSSRSNYLNTTGVTVNSTDILAYYVWIPRYKYKIWTTDMSSAGNEQSIDIEFESENAPMSLGTQAGEYKTHPSFWWDDDSDGEFDQGETVAGIWVGKFETTGTANSPTVLPNQTSLYEQNLVSQFNTSLLFSGGIMNSETGEVTFSGNSEYGLTKKTDSHMMKNSDWGAVAYLSHSKYGINEEVRRNNQNTGTVDNPVFVTGCGALLSDESFVSECGIPYGAPSTEENTYPQSTTGNISGVFDMSGGASEYVMANSYNIITGSGFSVFPSSKYYNLYNVFDFSDGGGHAIGETYSWYSDAESFNDYNTWLVRSLDYQDKTSSGIFSLSNISIENNSARSVLIPQNKYIVTFDANGGMFDNTNTLTFINGDSTEYNVNGDYIYPVSDSGLYQIELWGASGGGSNGGKGGYTSGILYLEESERLYVYVGGAGPTSGGIYNVGGYNGGGWSGANQNANSYGGGGATDVRLIGGTWDNSEGLNSRIMVAAGGAGATTGASTKAGNGGGLIGGNGTTSNSTYNKPEYLPIGANQTAAGFAYGGTERSGSFGYALQGKNTSGWGGGGGSGYYAGNTGMGTTGSGGSSFISGHTGCVAIESSSRISPRVGTNSGECVTGTNDNLCSIHYSNKKFNNTMMIDGSGYSWTNSMGGLQLMPNPNGGYYESGVGHSGDGAAKLTKIFPIKKVIYNDKYGNMPVPSRDDCKFLGWYTELDGGELVTSNTLVKTTGDHTLYARWEISSYTINYDMNGGEGLISTQNKVYGTDLTLSTLVPTRTDYKFLGWSTNNDATSAMYAPGDTYSKDEDVTLYAVWIPSVIYLFNNGDQNTNITGGWGTWSGYSTFTIDTTINGAYFKLSASMGGDAHTINKIDLTHYNTIKVHFVSYEGTQTLTVTETDYDHRIKTVYRDGDYITADISDLQGEYYIYLYNGPQTGEFKADQIWLE